MKKLIITSACVLAAAGAAFAQGNVNWGAISFAYMTAQTNTTTYLGGGSTGGGTIGAAGGSASLGTGFYFELLIGSVWNGAAEPAPSTIAALSTWTDSGLEATNANTPGRLAPINPNAGATVNALSTTVSNNIMLVGWSANLGATWSAALANMASASYIASLNGPAFFGESTVGYIEAFSTTTSPGASVFGNGATAQGLPIYSPNTQLYVLPAPEPGTLALAALGGASLLLFRRKE